MILNVVIPLNIAQDICQETVKNKMEIQISL